MFGPEPNRTQTAHVNIKAFPLPPIDKQPSSGPNAHHHPPEATTAEAKPLGTGRVNDVVRRLHQRSRLSIEYFSIVDILCTTWHLCS